MGEAKRRKRAGKALRRLVAPAAPPPLGKLVLPAGPGLPPPDIAAHAIAVAERIRAEVRAQLVAGSAAGDRAAMLSAIDAIGAYVIAAFEDELRERVASDADARGEMDAVQCRRGCDFCCHVDVVVSPLEVIRIASAMRRGMIPDRRAEIGQESSPNAACPLLVDHACSIYEMRPFACRSLFSPDAKACERGFTGKQVGAAPVPVPSLTWPRWLAVGYITGEVAALDDLGLASHLVELRRALALLLADDATVPRWLDGADVFPRP
jgi:hypothetical protein